MVSQPHKVVLARWLPVLVLAAASLSACKRPAEPVIPADLTGRWTGAYTIHDAAGRALTDSLTIALESDRGSVAGHGVRRRFVQDQPPRDAQVVVSGSVAASSFRLELGDPGTGHTAVFSGTVEDDTLRGNLTVDGNVMGRLDLTPAPPEAKGTEISADSQSVVI